jgi:cytochrome c biogenesis protein CcdA
MKRGMLAAATLGLLSVASPAAAILVEVTTSVAMNEADDQAKIKHAVQSAVDGVLKDAIAFTPTLVVLTRAVVVGERLYLRLLIADQDGEQTFKELAEPHADDAAGSASPPIEL